MLPKPVTQPTGQQMVARLNRQPVARPTDGGPNKQAAGGPSKRAADGPNKQAAGGLSKRAAGGPNKQADSGSIKQAAGGPINQAAGGPKEQAIRVCICLMIGDQSLKLGHSEHGYRGMIDKHRKGFKGWLIKVALLAFTYVDVDTLLR